MAGNYDKQVYIAREIFLKFNQDEIVEKLQLEQDENYLYLQLLNRMCRIDRKTGSIELGRCELTENRIECETDYEECLDYNVVMTIYDILCYPKEQPVLKGEWCPLAGLQVTMSSPSADLFSQKYADVFSGKREQLWEICEGIGGRRPKIMAGADVCWEFDLFPFFPVQFRFWDRDEEFPPQIKLMWDKNTLKFMHFETVYYAMHILLEEIMNCLCGVADKRQFFDRFCENT